MRVDGGVERLEASQRSAQAGGRVVGVKWNWRGGV